MLKKSQIKFLLYFAGVFFFLFLLLYSLDLVPQNIKTDNGESFRTIWDKTQKQAIQEQEKAGGVPTPVGEEPVRIVIEKIGVDATVANPNTTNISTLDDYLLKGAVRYPGSGLLGAGNTFIFGHSTGYAVVQNQAFKTFNGLKNLSEGDTITVYSALRSYRYSVRSVRLVDENQALVELGGTKNMLTLSTCNSFGAKSERYVVTADLIE